jgi:hypothetical protein
MTRALALLGGIGMAATLASGCLLKDTSETWYLEKSGAVTWVVLEKDVRSDASTIGDRDQEEGIYWLAVQQQRHPMAAGLQELGGVKLRTVALRAESPYTVQTEARFTGLDELGRRILASIGGMGTSIVTREGELWTWEFVIRDPASKSGVAEPSEGITALMNDLDKLSVVLISGRFEKGEGFDLSSDRRVARLQEKDVTRQAQAEEPVVTLRLVWK